MTLDQARNALTDNSIEMQNVLHKLIKFEKDTVALSVRYNKDSITPERKKAIKKELKRTKKNIKLYRTQLFIEINDVAACELVIEKLEKEAI